VVQLHENRTWFFVVHPSRIFLLVPENDAGFSTGSNNNFYPTVKHIEKVRVSVFLEILQFFVGYQTATLPIVTSLDLIAFGPHWWTFWIVHVLLGGLIPIYVLISRSGDSKAIAWACFLIVLTFASVRFNFLIPDLSVYKLEGLETTFFHNRLRTDYTPSLVEWLVSIWIISFGILIYVAGMRWLPVLSSTSKGGEKHA